MAAHGLPETAFAIEVISTSGDRIQDRPLVEVGGKALWTRELDRCLLAGETDLSVHSMKDVETVRPDALAIAAMLERADQPVPGVGALQHGGDLQRLRPQRLHVLHRMDAEIGAPVGQRPVQFLRPERLAAQFGQRAVLDHVS